MATITTAISEGRVISMKDGIHRSCAAKVWNCHNQIKKQTNADRIRAMSDDELADYIFGVSVHEKPCVLCSDDCDFCELSDEECKNRTLKWLQQEVE